MPDIVVAYQELSKDVDGNDVLSHLGSETFDGISEALLPRHDGGHSVFFVKKFSGLPTYRWFVERVELTAASANGCSYQVTLSKVFDPPPEYLSQTLKKSGKAINRIIHQGSLVEVDYGFIQAIGRSDGNVTSNKRYSDTRQSGEMHKRRLAIVVNVRRSSIQVVPVTSDEPSNTDKTYFELESSTLSKLKFYGSSGKRSWAICGMIETVSSRRVLPPLSYYQKLSQTQVGRDTQYGISLSKNEERMLRESLLHSIGVTDYQQVKQNLSDVRVELKSAESAIAGLLASQSHTATLEEEVEDLRLCKEIAEMWATQIGTNLNEEVKLLRELHAAS
ncbi:type II toxin-antitoxin system PemK/MazF family toxin [Stenotrophomonas maltophilia]|nr:type II toxin-antitoxin system PemK/MazF family toxin [Stenotrophomonas maltophilia]